jgi:hypothetical protein
MNLMELAQADKGEIEKKLMSSLNGKTVDQVIEEAEKLKEIKEKEKKEKEKVQALKEIKELEVELQKATESRKELSKFKVLKSRFTNEKRSKYSFRKEPGIELHVKNGTKHPISRAYFRGTLTSPGRSIPWLEETFNYQIRGGLEPGEKGEWNLAPNSFSDWGKIDTKPDMVFTVEVYQLDGVKGKTLFEDNWTDSKETRLKELKKTYVTP